MANKLQASFRLLVLILGFLVPAKGRAQYIKVTAPHQWQLEFKQIGENNSQGEVYRNRHNEVFEAVALHAFIVDGSEERLFADLERNPADLLRVRAQFFAQLGFADYTLLSIEKRKADEANFGFRQEVEARFLSASGDEVQTVERQYLNGGLQSLGLDASIEEETARLPYLWVERDGESFFSIADDTVVDARTGKFRVVDTH